MADETIVTESTPSKTPPSRKGGFFFLLLLIVLLAAASVFGYIRCCKQNRSLMRALTTLQTQHQMNRDDITTLQTSLADVSQVTQKAQDLVSQQAQMITDWKASQQGDLEKWYVAEAQYLVKLANDHLLFAHDPMMALVLLQRADEVLQNVNSPSILVIKKSLSSDIAALQTSPQTDLTTLYLKANALNAQLDKLPLPATPLPEKNQLESVDTQGLSWWKAGLDRSWAALKQIVVVRNTAKVLPLVLPDEKLFLYQNLHAQMENALWALLHRSPAIYQASLDNAIAWVKLYFVQDAQPTQQILQSLQDLRQIDIAIPKTDLSQTLTLLNDDTRAKSAPAQ